MLGLRPPLEIPVFPVERPAEYIIANLELFFRFAKEIF